MNPRKHLLLLALSLAPLALANTPMEMHNRPVDDAAMRNDLSNLHPLTYAQYLIEHGQLTEARQEILTYLPKATGGERMDVQFLLGVIAYQQGNHQEAANAFAIASELGFASTYNHAVATSHLNYEEAVNLLTQLLNATLDYQYFIENENTLSDFETDVTPEALTQTALLILPLRADLHALNGEHTRAMQDAETLRKITGDTPENMERYITHAINALPPQDALTLTFQQAPAEKRDLLLGRAYDVNNQEEYALQHYQAAYQTAVEAADADALAEIASYYARTERWGASQEAAEQALQANPNHPTGLYVLGLNHVNAHRRQAALEAFELALEHGSDTTATLYQIARNALATTNPEKAIAAAEAALLENGSHPFTTSSETTPATGTLNDGHTLELLVILARAHELLGNRSEALAFADAAAASGVATRDTLAYAGHLNYANNNFDTASSHYEKALGERSSWEVAKAQYFALTHQESYTQAREAISAYQTIAPYRGEALHLTAWAYARAGNYEMAVEKWKEAANRGSREAQDILSKVE